MHATPSRHAVRPSFMPALRTSTLRIALALPFVLGGCASSPSPEWDARFGESLRLLQATQLITPDAPTRHGQMVPPSDGRSVSEAMLRLTESYRSPPPSSALQTGAVGSSAAR
jgi:hypothetical protein